MVALDGTALRTAVQLNPTEHSLVVPEPRVVTNHGGVYTDSTNRPHLQT